MEDTHCPSYNSCQLVKDEDIIADGNTRLFYIINFCKANKEDWNSCKRLITKTALNFCPDFVLPDTRLTLDEIIDKFDNENLN